MSARIVAAAGAAVAFSSTLFACSAVLGFDTFSLDPTTTTAEGGQGPQTDGPATTEAGIPKCEDSDLASSPYHCGRCNHDCLGGACTGSVCQPIMVSSGLSEPEGLTITNDYIFVAEFGAGRIVKFDRTGKGSCSGTPCIFVENGNGADRPTGMGSDKQTVFWASYSGDVLPPAIRSCPIAENPCAMPTTLASFGTEALANYLTDEDRLPLQLVVRDQQVFWAENSTGAIQSAKVDGSGTNTYLLANSNYAPLDLAIGDHTIFFTTNGLGENSAGLFGLPRELSATPFQVAQAPAKTFGISLSPDQKNLYWTIERVGDEQFRDGAVQSAPSTETGDKQGLGFATTQGNARMVLTDDANVYWIVGGIADINNMLLFDLANGAIAYCPVKGCPPEGPTQLARAQLVPRHLAQDDTALYWTNEGSTTNDGQLWKMAKP